MREESMTVVYVCVYVSECVGGGVDRIIFFFTSHLFVALLRLPLFPLQLPSPHLLLVLAAAAAAFGEEGDGGDENEGSRPHLDMAACG